MGPKVDIHSHLIPGVDDGAKSIEDSINILYELEKLGYEKIITTPHIYTHVFPNKENELADNLAQLRTRITEEGLKIRVDLAAEYFIDDTFQKRLVQKEEILSFGQGRFVLIETGFDILPFNWDDVIFELKSSGYTPVLAHPERYSYIMENRDILEKWKEIGIKFQVTSLSLAGMYGRESKRLAVYMVKNNFCNFIGSDLHNYRQLSYLMKARKTRIYKRALSSSIMNDQLL